MLLTPEKFDTEKILLRRYEASDLTSLTSLINDEKSNFPFNPDENTEEGTKLLLERAVSVYGQEGETFALAVIDKANGEFIGDVAAVPVPDTFEVETYYRLLPQHQNKEKAVETVKTLLEFLFHEAGVDTIRFVCTHEGDVEVAQALGMTDKGTINQNGKDLQKYSMDIIDFYQEFPH